VLARTVVDIVSHVSPSKWRVLTAVLRRLVPQLAEASAIPTALSAVSFLALGSLAAYGSALAWFVFAIGRRLCVQRRIPTLVLLAGIGFAVRAVIALASGSTFVYFVQPVLGKLALSAALITSMVSGRPLVTRFAHDFCRMSTEIDRRPAVARLYRQLTYLWIVVNLGAASVTVVLLLTTRPNIFVTVTPVSVTVLTALGVAVTVCASVRTARSEGLYATLSADGRLSAGTRTSPAADCESRHAPHTSIEGRGHLPLCAPHCPHPE
jgi:hypothetical protein